MLRNALFKYILLIKVEVYNEVYYCYIRLYMRFTQQKFRNIYT